MSQRPPEPPHHHANGHDNSDRQLLEALARTTAHLAAQLTMTQIRLRALATELDRQNLADQSSVQQHVNAIARQDTVRYLEENLGEVLADMVEVDDLARQLIEFLEQPEP